MQIHSRPWTSSALLAITLAFAVGVTGDDDDSEDVEFEVRGSGIYLLTSGENEFEIQFAMHGERDDDDDEAEGRFRQSLVLGGLPIEFHGDVTCLAVDPVNGRVWVGGVITQNLSVHPSFTGELHQPGRDVWFRVLDTGRRSSEPDRSTFLGFEGSAGIATSEEYCEAQLWPDNNDRTHPVIEGKIRLKLDDD